VSEFLNERLVGLRDPILSFQSIIGLNSLPVTTFLIVRRCYHSNSWASC